MAGVLVPLFEGVDPLWVAASPLSRKPAEGGKEDGGHDEQQAVYGLLVHGAFAHQFK